MYRDVASDAPPPDAGVVAGRSVVAVVGIDRYQAWPVLDNAVRDARGAVEVLERLGFEQVVAPLYDGAATADAIRRLVTDDLTTLRSDDSLVLFFAGHGHTQTRTLQSGPVQTGYLIPVDGDRPDGRAATWLRLDTLLSDVARLPARHILVILDACHSGIVLGSVIKWRGGADAARGDSLDALRRRQSRRVITSALGDQRAMDSGPIHRALSIALVIVVGRRAHVRPAFLRSVRAAILRRKFGLSAAGFIVVLGTASGTRARGQLDEECSRQLANPHTPPQSSQFGISLRFVDAARACELIGRARS